MAELLIGSWLFEPNFEKMWRYEEDHLARMTEALGASFEPAFLARCFHRDKYFNADGEIDNHDEMQYSPRTLTLDVITGSFAHFTVHEEPTWPLRKLLTTFSRLEEDDLDAAERFLRRCLCLSPDDRATAKELADDPWLTTAV